MLDKDALFEAINYKPHPGQEQLHKNVDAHSFVTAVCGRRFGKSLAATGEAIYRALLPDTKFGSRVVYVVAPTYELSGKVFDSIVKSFVGNRAPLKPMLSDYYKRERLLELKTGAIIKAKTADNTKSLVGDGIDFLVIDESQFVSDDAWNLLYPALTEREGKVLSIGTPELDLGFFRRNFDYGFSSEYPEYKSLQLPTSTNPYISEAALERARKTVTERNWRIQYLAEWLTSDAAVFSSELLGRLTYLPEFVPPRQGRRYVGGVDVADAFDYTVVSIIDVTEQPYQVVYFERWNKDGYEAKAERTASILNRYNNAHAYVEANSIGVPFMEFLSKYYANYQAIYTTQSSKMKWVDNLTNLLEKDSILIPRNEVLLSELRSFKRQQTKQGVSFGAAEGYHDDVVMSMLLASQSIQFMQFPENHNLEVWV